MKRAAGTLHGGAARLGGAGILGLALLAFCASFYLSTVEPARLRLQALRSELAQAARGRLPPPLADDPDQSREALGAFYAFFPPSTQLSAQMRKVYQAAQAQAVALEQGEYRASRDSVGRLVRYQISLPMKGSYTQVRKFVSAVLVEVPQLSLESIQFERQAVGDPKVQARVRLVMFLGRPS